MPPKSKPQRRRWKGKERQEGDIVMPDPRHTDMVIPVMGPTGAGKSSFINKVMGKNVAPVGKSLESHTRKIQHYVLPETKDSDRRIVLVDTPGFDDTNKYDSEILRRIAVWLAQSYSDDMKLAGVVYLHDITMRRMFGTIRQNFDMFRKLCGKDALPNIILATTMWDEVKEEVGDQREKELRDQYWRDTLKRGSTMYRFLGTNSSALEIINFVLDKRTKAHKKHVTNSVQIQEELVELQRILPQTEAAQALRYTLKEVLAATKAIAEKLQEQEEPDTQTHEKAAENEQKIRSVLLQLRELKVPLSKRISAFFGLS